MRQAKSLTGILRDRSSIQGDALAFRFLADGTAEGTAEGAIDWSYRELAEAREAVLSAVAAEHTVRLSALQPGPPGTVFTTTSGKVRRGATAPGETGGNNQ